MVLRKFWLPRRSRARVQRARASPAPVPRRGGGTWPVTEPVGNPDQSCEGEGAGWFPAGGSGPTGLGTLGELLLPSCSPRAPAPLCFWRPQPGSCRDGGTGAGFSAAGAMVLLSVCLRQCRPFHGLQSGLDQALHDCGPCVFQNCVNLYLDPNGGTRDEPSSNNPWQEGQTGVGKDFGPIIGYSEEGMYAPF